MLLKTLLLIIPVALFGLNPVGRAVPQSQFVIHREAYSVGYDGRTKNPLWVYEILTAKGLLGDASRSSFKFIEDKAIPAHMRATPSDYQASGFDKGHLCPAGNNNSSKERM